MPPHQCYHSFPPDQEAGGVVITSVQAEGGNGNDDNGQEYQDPSRQLIHDYRTRRTPALCEGARLVQSLRCLSADSYAVAPSRARAIVLREAL